MRGTAPAASARTNPYAVGDDDLSDLFDELTDSDLQSRREREQAATAAQEATVDPLAAYQSTGKGGKRQQGGSRPLGVTLLAILNFFFALLAIGLGLLLLGGLQLIGDALADVAFLQNIATVAAVMILVAGLFYAAVGAGLLSKEPWGWWLGATVYSYNLFDRIFYFVFALVEGADIGDAAKGAGPLLFAAGILSYIFNEEIRQHFKLKSKPAFAAALTIGPMATLALLIHVMLHLMVGGAPVE